MNRAVDGKSVLGRGNSTLRLRNKKKWSGFEE